ncbi:MAG: hypothetical protein U0324_15630 [Polyangiales bacterium]
MTATPATWEIVRSLRLHVRRGVAGSPPTVARCVDVDAAARERTPEFAVTDDGLATSSPSPLPPRPPAEASGVIELTLGEDQAVAWLTPPPDASTFLRCGVFGPSCA